MALATTIARILLGLLFTFAGASAFLVTPPPQPGFAGTFNDVFVHSHWALFVGAAQLAIGVLLLINRFVPLALTMLAAFLYNSFAFHITMAQNSLAAPLVVMGLWVLLSLKYRALFALLFAPAPIEAQQSSEKKNINRLRKNSRCPDRPRMLRRSFRRNRRGRDGAGSFSAAC